MICKECGVELDEHMDQCPLCDIPVIDKRGEERFMSPAAEEHKVWRERRPLHRILWQITSVLLISGLVSTLVIDLTITRTFSWSIYPITICVIGLAYSAMMSLSGISTILRILSGWLISASLLFGLMYITPRNWPMALVFPILCSVNVFLLAIIAISGKLKKRSLNLVALVVLSIAMLCVVIDSIVSRYMSGTITLTWSVIVAASLIPVVGTIVFMYFRMKNNAELEKIFHT